MHYVLPGSPTNNETFFLATGLSRSVFVSQLVVDLYVHSFSFTTAAHRKFGKLHCHRTTEPIFSSNNPEIFDYSPSAVWTGKCQPRSKTTFPEGTTGGPGGQDDTPSFSKHAEITAPEFGNKIFQESMLSFTLCSSLEALEVPTGISYS